MPFEDRTGPLGQGRMTGRGRGYCARAAAPGDLHRGGGSGFGNGFGGQGRGQHWGRHWGQPNTFRSVERSTWETPATAVSAPVEQAQDVAALQKMIDELRCSLDQLGRRVEEMLSAPRTK
ncbi:MAG: DUF5320 domain-containing protein [Acidobacteriaceae bacterium]